MALLSLGLSAGAFYYFFRPRIVEKIAEKPVDRIVEKVVPAQCPAPMPPATVKAHTLPSPDNSRTVEHVTQGAGSAFSVGQQGGVTAGTINLSPPERHLDQAQKGAIADFAKDFLVTDIFNIETANNAACWQYGTEIFEAMDGKNRKNFDLSEALVGWGGGRVPKGTVVCVADTTSAIAPLGLKVATILDANSPVRVLASSCTGIKNNEVKVIVAEP